jgi:hypothetical protein
MDFSISPGLGMRSVKMLQSNREQGDVNGYKGMENTMRASIIAVLSMGYVKLEKEIPALIVCTISLLHVMLHRYAPRLWNARSSTWDVRLGIS